MWRRSMWDFYCRMPSHTRSTSWIYYEPYKRSPYLHFLLLVNVSLIGTGCVAVGMWGICSPISLPIRSPDKAFGTRAGEEEVSGFTAGRLPVERGPMWTGVICPPWTPALSPHNPLRVTSWRRQPSLGVTSCKSMTSLPRERISVEQRPETVWVQYIYMQRVCVCVCVCVCVWVCLTPTTQAFTPKVITSKNLSPRSLLISLSFTGSEREGTIGLHPNVCVHECVYVCVASGVPCVALCKHTK